MSEGAEGKLRRSFLHFGEMCRAGAPLYAALSPRVAADEFLLRIASRSARGQPPPNLLFGAVHFLLLGSVQHPLREFYPSVGGTRDAREGWPAFLDFCTTHAPTIEALVASRRVQTNVVGRSAMLLPAFGMVAERFSRPLALFEVGASAGLNLRLDRYRCEYSCGITCGPPESPVHIAVECRGPHAPPVPPTMPDIASRIGIDTDPVSVTDPEAMRWIEALIWPDDLDRIAMHRAAVSLGQHDPPKILKGDAFDLLPGLIEGALPGSLPVVFHSHAIYQMPSARRQEFRALIHQLGRRRDLAHISLEWLDPDPGPQLRLTTFASGERDDLHLASCHHHGRWIEWVGK